MKRIEERHAPLITFEGIDGSGKTTQIQLLSSWLEKKSIRYRIIREPGGTAISEKIRDLLLDTKNSGMNAVCEMFLFSAARAQVTSEVILPALSGGIVVICDRYYDSTTAYQGYGRGLDVENLAHVHAMATFDTRPDCTFFLDISPEDAFARKARSRERSDRMESAPLAFFQRVRAGYLELARKEPKRWTIVDASLSRQEIADAVIVKTELLLKTYHHDSFEH